MILLHAPNLILLPASKENLELSIEKPVNIEIARKFLPSVFLENVLKESSDDGLRCWALTKNRKGLFNRIKYMDEVLFSKRGSGLFTHFGLIIDTIHKKDFGDALWPNLKGNSYEYILFLKEVSSVNIEKVALLTELGFNKKFNLPGPVMIKEEEYLNFKKISKRSNISRLTQTQPASGSGGPNPPKTGLMSGSTSGAVIHTGEMFCPRCFGKGFVDLDDIRRLDMVGKWRQGYCRYCDAQGFVKRGITKSLNPRRRDSGPRGIHNSELPID